MRNTIVNYLHREDFISLNGRDFIPYKAVVLGLDISSHVHQLERRRKAYPNHFVDINNMPFISVEYAIRLERYHKALADLQLLKKGGSHV